MKLKPLIALIESKWPLNWAEDWDPVGLQLGDMDQEIRRIGVSLDWNPSTYQRLKDHADLVITHHPVFFNPLRGLRSQNPVEKLIRDTLISNIAIWSGHTNLDSAPDERQVSRALAKALGMQAEGQYFLPGDSETNANGGLGWVVESQMTRATLLEHVNKLPGASGVILNHARPNPDDAIGRTLLWGGSWDEDTLPQLLEQQVETLITGELGYHDQDLLKSYGIDSIMLGHDISEIPFLIPFGNALKDLLEENDAADIKITVDQSFGTLVHLS